MDLPYTAATIGALLIILQTGLMMNTGIYRGKKSVGVGFGDDPELERKIRRHGNLAENAAIFITVLALAEILFGTSGITMVLGGVFLVARVSHALAFNSTAGSHGQEDGPKLYPRLRVLGALGTALSGISLGLYVLVMLIL